METKIKNLDSKEFELTRVFEVEELEERIEFAHWYKHPEGDVLCPDDTIQE